MPGENNSEKFIDVKLVEGETKRGYVKPFVYDVMTGFAVVPNKIEIASDGNYVYHSFRLLEPGYYAFVEVAEHSTGSTAFRIIPVIAKHGALFGIDELVVVGTASDENEILSRIKNVIKEWSITLPQYAQRLEKENTSVLH